MKSLSFPEGKKFAFTILDDSETETVESTRPVYELLEQLGMRTTKTVWALRPRESRNLATSETLENAAYREFILGLRDKGFEIAWHGASPESSQRERTVEGLAKFRDVLGCSPRVYANNAFNRENLYWGPERVDQPLLKAVVQRTTPTPAGYFLGHVEASPFWWGDLCSQHIDYVRNLTFEDVNLARINPTMPYHDPARSLVRWWFSCSDADDCAEFNHLLRPDRQDRLEAEGGWCIVATHFGKGFVRNGQVDKLAQKRLEAIAARGGWYVPVVTLLDHLREAGAGQNLTAEEWDRMQWKWARDLVRRKLRQSKRNGATTSTESALSRT
jgi:hypothetical protein